MAFLLKIRPSDLFLRHPFSPLWHHQAEPAAERERNQLSAYVKPRSRVVKGPIRLHSLSRP
jgi:hypothetical protein